MARLSDIRTGWHGGLRTRTSKSEIVQPVFGCKLQHLDIRRTPICDAESRGNCTPSLYHSQPAAPAAPHIRRFRLSSRKMKLAASKSNLCAENHSFSPKNRLLFSIYRYFYEKSAPIFPKNSAQVRFCRSYSHISSTTQEPSPFCHGTVQGLCGANCRHSFSPFVPGVSKRVWTKEGLKELEREIEYDGKTYTGYEATQVQRRLETRMRDYKRRLAGYDGAIKTNGVDFQNMSIKLARTKETYKDFSTAAGLRYKFERAQVRGFTQSLAQRSVWANRGAIDKYARLRYNADGTLVATDVLKSNPPPFYKPNAVVDYTNKKGVVLRTIYDEHGRQKTRVHPTDHGNPKRHPVGGHVHDVKYDQTGKIVPNPVARAITDEERELYKDILK